MVRLAVWFISVGLWAQMSRDLMMQPPRDVVFVVTDAQGVPVEGAEVGHSGTRFLYRTRVDGRVTALVRGPAVVVRKVGYASVLVRIPGASEVPVTLQRQAVAIVPECAQDAIGLEGWSSRYRFRPHPSIQPAAQVNGADYGSNSYTVNGSSAVARQGAGVLWGPGTASNQEIWMSVELSERWLSGGSLDQRGKSLDGKRWRQIGQFGESVWYRDAAEPAAKVLDEFLDGLCLGSPAPARQ